MASVSDVSRIVNELITLIKTYLMEQTLVPLKRLGRYIGMGIAGSIFFSLGVLFASIGFLRFLQSLSTFEGTFSFVPYLLVSIADLAVLGVMFSLMSRRSLINERPKPKTLEKRNVTGI